MELVYIIYYIILYNVMLCYVMLRYVSCRSTLDWDKLSVCFEWVVWEERALDIITDDKGREKTTPNLIKLLP